MHAEFFSDHLPIPKGQMHLFSELEPLIGEAPYYRHNDINCLIIGKPNKMHGGDP